MTSMGVGVFFNKSYFLMQFDGPSTLTIHTDKQPCLAFGTVSCGCHVLGHTRCAYQDVGSIESCECTIQYIQASE
jgi:hypothetical protein